MRASMENPQSRSEELGVKAKKFKPIGYFLQEKGRTARIITSATIAGKLVTGPAIVVQHHSVARGNSYPKGTPSQKTTMATTTTWRLMTLSTKLTSHPRPSSRSPRAKKMPRSSIFNSLSCRVVSERCPSQSTQWIKNRRLYTSRQWSGKELRPHSRHQRIPGTYSHTNTRIRLHPRHGKTQETCWVSPPAATARDVPTVKPQIHHTGSRHADTRTRLRPRI